MQFICIIEGKSIFVKYIKKKYNSIIKFMYCKLHMQEHILYYFINKHCIKKAAI